MVDTGPPSHEWTTSETNRLFEILGQKPRYATTFISGRPGSWASDPKAKQRAIRLCGYVLGNTQWMAWVKENGWVREKGRKKEIIVATKKWTDGQTDPVSLQLAKLRRSAEKLKAKLGGRVTKGSRPPDSKYARRWAVYHDDPKKAWFFKYLKLSIPQSSGNSTGTVSTADVDPLADCTNVELEHRERSNKKKRKRIEESPVKPVAKRALDQPVSPSLLFSSPSKPTEDSSEEEDVVFVGVSRSVRRTVSKVGSSADAMKRRRVRSPSIINISSDSDDGGSDSDGPTDLARIRLSSDDSVMEVIDPIRPSPPRTPPRVSASHYLPISRRRPSPPLETSRPAPPVRAPIREPLDDEQSTDPNSDQESRPRRRVSLLQRQDLERWIIFTNNETLFDMFSDPNIRPQQAWRLKSRGSAPGHPGTVEQPVRGSAENSVVSDAQTHAPKASEVDGPLLTHDRERRMTRSSMDMDIDSDSTPDKAELSTANCSRILPEKVDGVVPCSSQGLPAPSGHGSAIASSPPRGRHCGQGQSRPPSPRSLRPDTPPLTPDAGSSLSAPPLVRDGDPTALVSSVVDRPIHSASCTRIDPERPALCPTTVETTAGLADTIGVNHAGGEANEGSMTPTLNRPLDLFSSGRDRVSITLTSPHNTAMSDLNKRSLVAPMSTEGQPSARFSHPPPMAPRADLPKSDALVSTWKVSSSILDLLLTQLRLHPATPLVNCQIGFSAGHHPFKSKLIDLISSMGGVILAPEVLCHPGWAGITREKRYLIGPVGQKPAPGLQGIRQLDVLEFLALLQQKLLSASS